MTGEAPSTALGRLVGRWETEGRDSSAVFELAALMPSTRFRSRHKLTIVRAGVLDHELTVIEALDQGRSLSSGHSIGLQSPPTSP